MDLPADMDPECVPLCKAINSIPGLETTCSCCGHGESSFDIWFWAKTVRSLYVLARAIDRRYGGPEEWCCLVEDMDLVDKPVVFRLTSGESRGPEAYARASIIVASIFEALNHPVVMKEFVNRDD